MDHVGNFVRRAEAAHRNLLLDDLLRAGRQDRGVDLAGRDRVDPDAARPEIVRHLAGQGGEGSLRGGVGRAGKGMDPAAGDRGHVDDAAMRFRELGHQAAGERDRGEEIDVEHPPPQVERRVDRAEPAAGLVLGRDRRVVDQRIEPAAAQAVADLLDAALHVVGLGEVDLHVVLVAARPRAEHAEGLARHGDHPPAAGAELLHRRMADAAARAGQHQGARVVEQGNIHGRKFTPPWRRSPSPPWPT